MLNKNGSCDKDNSKSINIDDQIPEQPCLVKQMMDAELQKPREQRTSIFHISCPCKKCNPFTL